MVCDKDSGERSMAQWPSYYIYALSAKLVGVGRMLCYMFMLFSMSFFNCFFFSFIGIDLLDVFVLSCQPKVTVTYVLFTIVKYNINL